MQSDDFKRAREDLGRAIGLGKFTQTEMSRLLDMATDRPIRRYEDGDTAVSGPVKRLLAIYLENAGLEPRDYGLEPAPALEDVTTRRR